MIVVTDDNVASAIRISHDGQQRMRHVAGIWNTEWEDQEFPESDTRRQASRLVGRELDDLITEADVVSRRPYVCASCGGTFTVSEYFKVKGNARRNNQPSPFGSGSEAHEACSN